ncbi:hypothetical protein RQM20_010055 [Citrobacter freundii]|uniref:hypothetical protein n=1 Tax=Citrobacter freundii TaxID=546 RepID=UPI0028BE5E4F|nr:hypothetical protein [Citrobacter freundii]MDT7342976.1 hypothetical protein [Citrobacter freundii]
MSNTSSSKEYAQKPLRNIERINREKDAQENRKEEPLKIFNDLNIIISNAVSENGLSEFITLTPKKVEVELSNTPYQSSQKCKFEIDYLEASCAGVELTFFEKDTIHGHSNTLSLSFTVAPEKSQSHYTPAY